MEITKPMDYLKCYGHKYRTAKIPELEKINGETLKFKLRNEQEVVLRTKHKSPTDFEPNFFHIWLLDDENLVASLPPNSASILLKRFPEYFEKRYSFKDMVELKFKETNLDKVAEPLKI
nr:hypothetical protein [bacterium]